MSATITIEDFRAHTERVLRRVMENEETTLVAMTDGRAFALVPDADFPICDETAYLNSTPENRAALAKSRGRAEEGETVNIEL